MKEYRLSKRFDMDIPFEELIKYNKTCKIDLDSIHHFETYEKVLIYVSHPNNKEKFSIQLGSTNDGIMYEGDYGCQDDFTEIPIEQGLKILEAYRQFILKKTELEQLLFDNKVYKNIIQTKFM